MMATIRRVSFVPVRRINCWPAQAPTPAISSPVAMASNAVIRTTTGSPNPPTASFIVSTPVRYSAIEAQTATMAAGMRFQTKSTIAATMIESVMII
jgi:hypothetical protein